MVGTAILTDFNSLSPNSRRALFDSPVTPGLLKDIQTIANASDLVTRSGKQYANPSGTAQATASLGTLFGAAIALSAGRLRELTAIGTFVGGSYGGAKLMTNPSFVKWLAESPKIKPDRLAVYAARLSTIAENTNDQEEKAAILGFRKHCGKEQKSREYQNRSACLTISRNHWWRIRPLLICHAARY